MVILPAGAGGLDKESVALCHQITTLDRGKFTPLAIEGVFCGLYDKKVSSEDCLHSSLLTAH